MPISKQEGAPTMCECDLKRGALTSIATLFDLAGKNGEQVDTFILCSGRWTLAKVCWWMESATAGRSRDRCSQKPCRRRS